MKVKAIAPWFGGKRTLAPEIVKQLGEHTQYFEPFCGSMAVLFAKEPSQKETVNDLHGDLINLAHVIRERDTAEVLYDRLARTPFCEDFLPEAREHLERSDQDPVDQAYWYFLACWMGRNGTAGTARRDYQLAVRWSKNGGSPTVCWRNAVDSLPAWHQRLQRVVILRRDAFRIVDRFEDCPATAMYVDPPYVIDGQSRSGVKSKNDRSHTYQHEFSNGNGQAGLFETEQDDHERLTHILRSYEHARVVVSYYDCEKVRQLYDGWTFVEHTRAKNLHNSPGGRQPRNYVVKEAPEILIINGPSYEH